MNKQKVGQEAFMTAWSHKYLLKTQQYSTAALANMNQVTPQAVHSFVSAIQYTHTVQGLSVSSLASRCDYKHA